MKVSFQRIALGLILALSTGSLAHAELYATLANSSNVSSATYDPLASSQPIPADASSSSSSATTSNGDSSSGCTSCSSGCNSCNGDVCYTNRSRDWACTIGVEATYLSPLTHDDTATIIGALQGSDFLDIEKFEAAPRIWVGFENECGRGIRASYWQYDAEDRFDTLGLLPTTSFTDASENMEAYTVDLEYTRRFEHGCWDTLASFGVRTAGLSRSQVFHNFDQFAGVNARSTNENEFNGTGLTAALEGRRPLGSHVSFVGNIRGSVLWGTSNVDANSMLVQGGVTADQIALVNQDSTMWVVEGQAGLEWSKYLQCFNGMAFARFMFEYQSWNVDDPAFELTQAAFGSILTTSSLSNDVDFIGFTVAVGISR